MRSAVIAVGTELLFGKVVNTNAAWISRQLNELGIDVLYHYTMGDNPGRLRRTLEFALEDCDLIIVTGGLGPTEDDLTKETVCDCLGVELVKDTTAEKRILEFFEKFDYTCTENNMKQALVPAGGEIFYNSFGTAPGFAVEKNGRIIMALPGVPREMMPMFTEWVRPYLMKLSDAVIYSESIKVFGIGESMVETLLLDYIDGQTDPTIATYAKLGDVEVRVTSKKKTEEEARAVVHEVAEKIRKILGPAVYSVNGREIQEEMVERLRACNMKLALSDAASGGRISARISSVPGYEDVMGESFLFTSSCKEEKGISAPDLCSRTGCRIGVSVYGYTEIREDGISESRYRIEVMNEGTLYSADLVRHGRNSEMNLDYIALNVIHMLIRVLDGDFKPDIYDNLIV